MTGRRGGDAGLPWIIRRRSLERLSFPLLPLACVAVRYAALSLGWLRLSAGVISMVCGSTSLAGLPAIGPAQAAHLHMSGGRRGRALPRRGGDAGAVKVAAARRRGRSTTRPALRKSALGSPDVAGWCGREIFVFAFRFCVLASRATGVVCPAHHRTTTQRPGPPAAAGWGPAGGYAPAQRPRHEARRLVAVARRGSPSAATALKNNTAYLAAIIPGEARSKTRRRTRTDPLAASIGAERAGSFPAARRRRASIFGCTPKLPKSEGATRPEASKSCRQDCYKSLDPAATPSPTRGHPKKSRDGDAERRLPAAV